MISYDNSDSSRLIEVPSKEAVFIIGAGHFGSRAARLLNQEKHESIFVLDTDQGSLSRIKGLGVRAIESDGISFLVENYHLLSSMNIIIPAVPVHLAYEWLKLSLKDSYEIKMIQVPKKILSSLPFSWPGSEGSLLVSYADFMCPDDCPEPEYCTVTGEKRDKPLYSLLEGLELPGFGIRVIRSRQLAPGLGGYTVSDLTGTAEMIKEGDQGRWLLATSCKCHGIVTAFEMDEIKVFGEV